MIASETEATRAPLRIGLFIDSCVQPLWIRRVIEDIQASAVAAIALVIKNDTENRRRGPIRRLLESRRSWLYVLYRTVDDALFKVAPDAFETVTIQDLISSRPVLPVRALRKGPFDYFREEDTDAILGYKLDVGLRFGFRILRGRVLEVARYGIWSYHHGDASTYRGGPAGFWEVMEGNPVTGSVLQVLTEELDNGKIIDRSFASTDKRSVRRNRNNYYWKTSTFVMRRLRDLHEDPQLALSRCGDNALYRPYYRRLYKTPDNAEMLGLLSRLVGKYARDKIGQILHFNQWFVAYRFRPGANSIDDTFYRFHRLLPPKDRFWADPFPVRFRDKYYVFVEEFLYEVQKGRISVFEIDRHAHSDSPICVLERPYHLSYPLVFSWQGAFYMIPETSRRRTVELYRSRSFPFEWELERILMDNVNAVDTTVAEIGGVWWMFANIAVDGALNYDELHLFFADTPLGPWNRHRRNPVKSDVRSSRPAGRIFEWNGDYYRPAQDCSEGYGYAMTMNKICRLDTAEYLEVEVSKMLPNWGKGLVGTHTLNHVGELTCIDGLLKRRRI